MAQSGRGSSALEKGDESLQAWQVATPPSSFPLPCLTAYAQDPTCPVADGCASVPFTEQQDLRPETGQRTVVVLENVSSWLGSRPPVAVVELNAATLTLNDSAAIERCRVLADTASSIQYRISKEAEASVVWSWRCVPQQ